MNLTDRKFWTSERARLCERLESLRAEADNLHARLTENVKETALVDDVIRRIEAHLPPTEEPHDVVAITKGAA